MLVSLAPPTPSPLVPGYRLDRYELLCPIADGGMAQVWVARLHGKHGFEKLVAIKSILPKFAEAPQFQTMFLDEARIASGIEHTNVAQIFDLGDEHGVLYLAMEWVDGDALTKLHRALDKKKELIPPGVLLRIVADTCGGLHAAHELRGKDGKNLGVVHRDVSPQNILVTTRGVAKLIDFGIAKARDRGVGETTSGTLKGKVHYMAPEQALGQAIDRRADVWAVGAILYHLLTGKLPFDAGSQLATLHLLATSKVCPPLPDTIPPPVAEIVKRALTFDRDKRFATAAEIQAAIEAAMVTAHLATTTGEVAAFIEKHLAGRAAKRREAIDLSLAAAAERARMQDLLKPPNPDSSISKPGAAQLVQAQSERLMTVPGFRVLSPDEKLPPPPSVPTAATLMAAVESSIGPLPVRKYRSALVAAVGVGGVILGVAVMAALRARDAGWGGGAASATAAGAGPPGASSAAAMLPSTGPSPSEEPPSASGPASAATHPPDTAGPASAMATASPSATSHAATVTRAVSAPPRPATPRKIPKVIDNGF
jgi:serine/threonine-protein kinase